MGYGLIEFSLLWILKCGQLNLERYKFWLLTSQLLALNVCLL
ncbi:DUF645 family protein [Vibrio cholerae]|nr:DUF645 family protein [Vibrio cholerae]EIF8949808.1 DUF645 family protein [Vibrio cholerae]EJL6695652.1 DUF645 family protein [Vibrio cholerae]EJL6912945.1 DUF645 family protein [Vibrio cholerae]EKF9423075.1 DUF645 family protein [Vibrio cholerae]